MVRTLAFGLSLVAGGIVALAQTPAPQAPPQFRASVDLMRIDVTVLDKKTRTPVRGLTASDFEVRVGGQNQPIEAVAERQASAGTESGAEWQASAPRDVVGNAASVGRLIVVVMDDSQGGLWHGKAAKRVGHRIIDELNAEDMAAIVFVKETVSSQDFTMDRTLLHAAVDAFDINAHQKYSVPSPGGTIRSIRNYLSSVANYRRAIMVVTSHGYELSTGPSVAWGFLRDAGLNDVDHESASSAQLEPASRLGHVPVYFFTTFGLTVSTDPRARKAGEDTITLARFAGGRAIVENNAPETQVASVFRELDSIYTLAYAPTFPLDGKLRYADIKVQRPDVMVLPASGGFRTARELKGPAPLHLTLPRGRSGKR